MATSAPPPLLRSAWAPTPVCGAIGAAFLLGVGILTYAVLEAAPEMPAWTVAATLGATAGVALLAAVCVGLCRRLRRQAAALRQSEARFRAFTELSADLFWEMDADGLFTFIGGAPDNLARKAPRLSTCGVGRTLQEAAHPDFDPQLLDAQARMIAARQAFRGLERPSMEMDGRWVSVCGDPVFDDAGRYLGMRGTYLDITARRRLQEQLEAGFDCLTVGSIVIDVEGVITMFNKAAEAIFGYVREEVIGRNVSMLMPASHGVFHDDYIRRYLNTGEARIVGKGRELTGKRKNGDLFPMHLGVGDLQIGNVRSFIGSVTDLTERTALERQLFKAQRMEAIGQLSGGIAHDFNNVMSTILGSAELLAMSDDLGAEDRALLDHIMASVGRAESLTSRLLAFARRQPLSPAPTDVARLVDGMSDMFQRTLGEHIELLVVSGPAIRPALVDAAQLENALLNLVLNARDAMPDGGVVCIEVGAVSFDEGYAERYEDVAPGDYVAVSVSDNGVGMPPEVAAQAIEPFFTTKDPDKGSGLGLSMAYGFAKQSGGHFTIKSSEGRGAEFKLFLPMAAVAAEPVAPAVEPEAYPRGQGRILVVEDDPDVRRVATSLLRRQGYRIVEAADGPSAIAALRNHGRFDLLFTDMVLPNGMNGAEVARIAVGLQPDIKTLFASGYVQDRNPDLARILQSGAFLQKPYRGASLLRTMRDMLSAGSTVEPRPHAEG